MQTRLSSQQQRMQWTGIGHKHGAVMYFPSQTDEFGHVAQTVESNDGFEGVKCTNQGLITVEHNIRG